MTGGARVDTNSAWIAIRLEQLGYEVRFHTLVGDRMEDCVDVLRTAAGRSDIAICTGGLGPTRDDLTREAIAIAAGVELEFREDSMHHIEAMFARRNRQMPERNRNQAMFPIGSRTIFNPQGTAPGVDMLIADALVPQNREVGGGCRVFALPGVPAEMKQMFEDSVIPELAMSRSDRGIIQSKVLKFFGTGESDMEQRLGDLIDRGRNPRVGITVSSATISLRITATASTDLRAKQMIQVTADEIVGLAGEFYFGEGEEYEQQHAIADQLQSRGETMGIVEYGFAASLSEAFTALENSDVYRGSIQLASRPTPAVGPTDSETLDTACPANWSLKQVSRLLECDWLLVVDRYPTLQAAEGAILPAADVRLTVYHSLGDRHTTTVRLGGHPSILQARIAKAAMAWFREILRDR